MEVNAVKNDETTNKTSETEGKLRANTIGVLGIVFYVIAMVGPLATVLTGGAYVFSLNGIGTPGIYLTVGITVLIFSVGFVALSRRCTSCGGYASFIALAFGNRVGTSAAYTSIFNYTAALIASYAAAATYASRLCLSLAGTNIPWQLFAYIMFLIVAFTGYREVNISMKVLGTLMICEMVILLVLDAAVLIHGRPGGFTFASYAPGNIFTPAFGAAFMFAFACFGGFEATVVYSEEAKNPKKTVPRAIYLVVILLTVFYSFTTWAIFNGLPGKSLQSVIANNMTGFISDLTAQQVGRVWAVLMEAFVVTSLLASCIGVHNVLARYLFALGRAGVLPAKLSHTHPKYQSPYIASILQTLISLIIITLCAVSGSDVFTKIFGLSCGIASLTSIIMMAWCSLSTVVFFRRIGDKKENHMKVFVAPLVSCCLLLIVAGLMIRNFSTITGGTAWLWVLIPISAILGYMTTYLKKSGSINLVADYDACQKMG